MPSAASAGGGGGGVISNGSAPNGTAGEVMKPINVLATASWDKVSSLPSFSTASIITHSSNRPSRSGYHKRSPILHHLRRSSLVLFIELHYHSFYSLHSLEPTLYF